MEHKIEDIFMKLIVIDNYSELINQLLMDNQSMEFSKIVRCVINHLEQMKNPTKIEQLAGLIGQLCYQHQTLKYINEQIISLGDDEENSLKKKFIKMVLKETGIK